MRVEESNGKPEICVCVCLFGVWDEGAPLQCTCMHTHPRTQGDVRRGDPSLSAPQKLSQAFASLNDLEMSDRAKQKAREAQFLLQYWRKENATGGAENNDHVVVMFIGRGNHSVTSNCVPTAEDVTHTLLNQPRVRGNEKKQPTCHSIPEAIRVLGV